MKTFVILLAAAVLGGCASTPTPNYDTRFGEAVRQSRHAMTLNPNAGQGSAAPVGMDGLAVRDAVDRYHDTFKAPPPVVNVINIGGSVSGSGGGGQ